MKAEEKLRQVYPDAYLWGGWVYRTKEAARLGLHAERINDHRDMRDRSAWADAWRRIKEAKGEGRNG